MPTSVTIAETGGRFRNFAPYVASINDAGVVAFQATLAGGGSGVFAGDGVRIDEIPSPGEVRSHPDINRGGSVCFYTESRVVCVEGGRPCALGDETGSPPGGSIGLYSGPDPNRLLGLGTRWADSEITRFVLNPVSLNRAGQLALRLELANGHQSIIRLDP